MYCVVLAPWPGDPSGLNPLTASQLKLAVFAFRARSPGSRARRQSPAQLQKMSRAGFGVSPNLDRG